MNEVSRTADQRRQEADKQAKDATLASMKRGKKPWQKLMDQIPDVKPMNTTKAGLERLHAAFPWADPGTLAWVSHCLRGLAHNLINVLEEKYKPKLLRLDVRRDLESWIGDVVLDYIRDDMELWEKRVEQSDLITAKEMMELWSK